MRAMLALPLPLPCRTEVDTVIERRVRDFRLDSRLRGACAGAISQLCSELADETVVDTYDAAVANCLQVGGSPLAAGSTVVY